MVSKFTNINPILPIGIFQKKIKTFSSFDIPEKTTLQKIA